MTVKHGGPVHKYVTYMGYVWRLTPRRYDAFRAWQVSGLEWNLDDYGVCMGRCESAEQ